MRPIIVSVDDDQRVLDSIAMLMESAGYTPQSFTSAEGFLQSPALAEAACVIADVQMPGVDGLELERRIRLTRPGLPVIFISAHGDDAVRNQTRRHGAAAFFDKPFDGGALLVAITKALSEQSTEHLSK
jgi:FixJ family two-component response regulator